jgi:2,3-bisphosphoglycerate-independent phosphoglycerate mutase
MAVALVFVDGVGVGNRSVEWNPLNRAPFLLSHFDDGTGTALPHGGRVARVDATLGVDGRPQSASGQATLYTGINAPAALGKHLVGYPNPALRALIEEHSLFRQVVALGGRATLANAFPAPYLELLGLPYAGPRVAPFELPERRRRHLRPPAGVLAAAVVGPLRTIDDARAGRALTHDITGGARNRHRGEVPFRKPAEAAEVLLGLLREHDFVLFEHFLLDEMGHDQTLDAALPALAEVDQFLRAAVDHLPPSDHLLVVSDHGNLEDLSTRNHTRNPVPLLAFGRRAAEIAGSARSLADVAPWVLELTRSRARPISASTARA